MRGEVHILVYCPIDTLQWGSTHSAMGGYHWKQHQVGTMCELSNSLSACKVRYTYTQHLRHYRTLGRNDVSGTNSPEQKYGRGKYIHLPLTPYTDPPPLPSCIASLHLPPLAALRTLLSPYLLMHGEQVFPWLRLVRTHNMHLETWNEGNWWKFKIEFPRQADFNMMRCLILHGCFDIQVVPDLSQREISPWGTAPDAFQKQI